MKFWFSRVGVKDATESREQGRQACLFKTAYFHLTRLLFSEAVSINSFVEKSRLIIDSYSQDLKQEKDLPVSLILPGRC